MDHPSLMVQVMKDRQADMLREASRRRLSHRSPRETSWVRALFGAQRTLEPRRPLCETRLPATECSAQFCCA